MTMITGGKGKPRTRQTINIGADLLSGKAVRDSVDGLVGNRRRFGPILPAVRRAIVLDRCMGDSSAAIAAKYKVNVQSVRDIYNEFVTATRQAKALADQPEAQFRTSIRRKAVNAIESGLDCNNDPYRQAAVGINVMKGIGEFRSDTAGASVTINNMVASVPADWKARYISARPVQGLLAEGQDPRGGGSTGDAEGVGSGDATEGTVHRQTVDVGRKPAIDLNFEGGGDEEKDASYG